MIIKCAIYGDGPVHTSVYQYLKLEFKHIEQ